MRPRGHALLVLMMILAVSLCGVGIIATRLSVDTQARRSNAVRFQSLWLARSALTSGTTGAQIVATQWGPARVRIETKKGATVAVAEVAGSRAEVTRGPSGAWQESFSTEP